MAIHSSCAARLEERTTTPSHFMTTLSIDHAALLDQARNILVGYGADQSEAAIVANAMVWSDLAGRPNQGVWRLSTLTQRLSQGHIKSPCQAQLSITAPAIGLLDGDQGCGHFVGHKA